MKNSVRKLLAGESPSGAGPTGGLFAEELLDVRDRQRRKEGDRLVDVEDGDRGARADAGHLARTINLGQARLMQDSHGTLQVGKIVLDLGSRHLLRAAAILTRVVRVEALAEGREVAGPLRVLKPKEGGHHKALVEGPVLFDQGNEIADAPELGPAEDLADGRLEQQPPPDPLGDSCGDAVRGLLVVEAPNEAFWVGATHPFCVGGETQHPKTLRIHSGLREPGWIETLRS